MSNEVKIDKGIEIPVKHTKSQYPWHEMEVGDSFFIEKRTLSMGSTNRRFAPLEFVMRGVDGGFRVWRVK